MYYLVSHHPNRPIGNPTAQECISFACFGAFLSIGEPWVDPPWLRWKQQNFLAQTLARNFMIVFCKICCKRKVSTHVCTTFDLLCVFIPFRSGEIALLCWGLSRSLALELRESSLGSNTTSTQSHDGQNPGQPHHFPVRYASQKCS